MLSKLRDIRSTVKDDGDVGSLKKENAELKDQVSRLNYRMKFLLRALEEGERK